MPSPRRPSDSTLKTRIRCWAKVVFGREAAPPISLPATFLIATLLIAGLLLGACSGSGKSTTKKRVLCPYVRFNVPCDYGEDSRLYKTYPDRSDR